MKKILFTCLVTFEALILLQLLGCQLTQKQARPNNIVRVNFEAGDYDLVITNAIQYRLSKPNGINNEENQYLLARAYYETNNFYSAYDEFQKYLGKYPKGQYRANSLDYIKKIYESKKSTETKTDKDIKLEAEKLVLEQKIAQEPGNIELMMELAEAEWQLGKYDDAVQTYIKVIEADPEMKRDSIIQTRLEFRPDGTVIGTVDGISYTSEKGAAKLEFNDLHDYTSKDPAAYHVTGFIKNNGDKTATNVKVVVELYDISSNITDTKTVEIGKLIPQEERSFSVKFKNPGKTVHNVRSYECKAVYR